MTNENEIQNQSPDDYKLHLMHDVQLIERVKQQKLDMIKYYEAQVRDIEDDYLDKTLSKFGNVFNGWNQIKAGGTGFTSGY